MSLSRRNNIDCKACKHLYITYNHKYPYGCRAFKFISKKMPGLNSFFGIDFIIFKKKYYFLEINPRITTSYKNIKKNIKIKTAKKILNTL